MTVSELLARISSTEFHEWMAFDSMEPISSEWRADMRHAVLCAHLAALHGVKASAARTPKTYMPDYDGSSRPEQKPDQILAVAQALARSGIGRIVQGGASSGDDCNACDPAGGEG